MEIGSFIELQFPVGNERYKGDVNIARLNSGRAAIWHSFRVLGCKALWVPYYQCDSVREFLCRKGTVIKYYHIDCGFGPVDLFPEEGEAVLLVNYYGIMSHERMASLARKYRNVIIDNSQAFFNEPVSGCMNVYSARKFIGVPDGAYVIGNEAEKFVDEYEQCYSSDTALFLLQRIEYGCEGKAYQTRMVNEHRIDREDIMKMSKLTRSILDGTDYEHIKARRRDNYRIASQMFKDVNRIDPKKYYSEDCVPIAYPLVVEDEKLLQRLLEAKHFQGHWWSYLVDELPEESFEHWISKYIIPITIDQRYGEKELKAIENRIKAG